MWRVRKMGRELTKEDIIKYCRIIGCVLIIITALIVAISAASSARTIKVNISVGDSYDIINVKPDKSVDMEDVDGIVRYTVTRQDGDGLTDFTITAQKKGKVTIKAKDSAGNKYKYKVRVTE